ncbi:hypothetical protein C3Z14_07975 [Proteus mirabilis]|uniref:hypothetical protein n=1 Tax=Proteus mirabilis TaxID=584 RepID=UPI000CE069BB|nr:hypothetical protein [Proteus mirabilis]AVA39946.1 hypothetical protein C3Z14_07975 [Proteus mirabilis]EKU4145922.1 hypothetical protein [Proteus mirabilis]EKU6441365.1 hypothetical protein [Proteus mirabilis]EKU6780076.1 hypothetical protein [Proteus mirabilis]EKU7261926.1 hypothetical protein [Proteus mirabilis]
MDILFELFLPKDINLESFDLNEIFVEWAGEKYSQDPKQYQWKDFVIFEEYKDTDSYNKLIGNEIILENYNSYTLKGNSINLLQEFINEGKSIENNELYLFFKEVLSKINNWVVLTLIDYDQFDKIYKISGVDDALSLLEKSCHSENPEGIALIKNTI